jgi:hypothetical protein
VRLVFDNLPATFKEAGGAYPSRVPVTIGGQDTTVIINTSTQHVLS